MTDKCLTVGEVSKILHVRKETVRRYIQQGAIVAIALPGGDYRIQESELDKILTPTPKGAGMNDITDDTQIREFVAKELFATWVEAKQSEGSDEWDTADFDSLPDKHKHEYYKTADRIISVSRRE